MKDLKISKELLENVLDFKIEKFQVIGTLKVTQIRIWKENNYSDFLNDYCIDIHHFAFKCKEWAFKKGYEIHSNFREVVAIFKEVRKIENVGHFKRLPLLSWEEIEYERDTNTEVEAIIKACEWLLNEVDK